MARTFLELALAGLLLLAAFFWLDRHDALKDAAWKRELETARAQVKVAAASQAKATVRYDTVRAGWLGYKDRIVHDTVTPPTPRELAIIAHTDTIVAACDSLRAADSVLIHAQAHEIKIAEHPPGPPRVQAYGEALYDFAERTPVARVGVLARVVGPVDLSAALGLALPATGQRGLKTQALVGVRVRF